MYTEFVSNKNYSEQGVVCEGIITYITTCVVIKEQLLYFVSADKCLESSNSLFLS